MSVTRYVRTSGEILQFTRARGDSTCQSDAARERTSRGNCQRTALCVVALRFHPSSYLPFLCEFVSVSVPSLSSFVLIYLLMYSPSLLGLAIVVRRWVLTSDSRVRCSVITCQIRYGVTGTWTDFAPRFFAAPLLLFVPQLLPTRTSSPPKAFDTSDHAAHYRILGFWIMNNQVSSSGNASELFVFVRDRFESRPGYRVCRKVFVVFFSPSHSYTTASFINCSLSSKHLTLCNRSYRQCR
jgi:hypothetical protein